MKKGLVFLLLASLSFLSCTVVHAKHHRHVDAYGTSDVIVHDYVYDYNANEWIQVNTYVDHMDCHDAARVISQVNDGGFYLSIDGSPACPSSVEYAVYHNAFFMPWLVYSTLWNHYHYSYHHSHIRAKFHRHVSFNASHHYAGFHYRHNASSHYKSHMRGKFHSWKHKSKYKKWNKSHKHHSGSHHGRKFHSSSSNRHSKKHHKYSSSRRSDSRHGYSSHNRKGGKKRGKKYGKTGRRGGKKSARGGRTRGRR